MKTVPIRTITTITGGKLKIPPYDGREIEADSVLDCPKCGVRIHGIPRDEYIEMDTIGAVKHLIIQFPSQLQTNQDGIHGQRLWDQVTGAEDGVLKIEDAEYEWFENKLKDDKVGSKIFGMNLQQVRRGTTAKGVEDRSELVKPTS